MKTYDWFWVDANDVQTPSIALKELSEQPQEDGANLLVLKRTQDQIHQDHFKLFWVRQNCLSLESTCIFSVDG